MAHLRLSERKAIETGWNAGDSIAEIAAKIGRSPPTVAREICYGPTCGARRTVPPCWAQQRIPQKGGVL